MQFATAVQTLIDGGVDFVLIGGWAAILNGSVRTTVDVDICYARTRDNHRLLAAALAPFRPRPRDFPGDLPFIWDETTIRNGSTFTLVTTLGPIDLFDEVPGIGTFNEVKASSKRVEAFDRSLLTLDLRGLITAKRATGRPKDLEALLELESLLDASDD